MDSFIVAENLGHVYRGGTVALDDVNLNIGTGLFGLLGSNGAGKSTFMRIICTLLVPTQGRVTVGGLDVVTDRREVRKLFGYLPQEFGAWRLQRVEEVLDTLALLSGLEDTSTRKQRIASVLAAVGLEKVADRKVKQLSGGMLRRLGVAQALVHEPRVLIMDEPTVGLDPEERLRFRQLMTDLSRDRVILLSTHIVADLGSGCSDLALIDHGQLQFRGAPSELVALARNKVCEVTVTEIAEADVSTRMEVVARTVRNGTVTLRGVIKDGVVPGARIVEDITLEEAYLAFMTGRGRRVEVLEIADN
ncbi:MAG: ATP-binding cassette protein [Gammaproteobacteria bacterium]|nr:ATP-binding cassette protein [Gammaproteobacteria bacterium]